MLYPPVQRVNLSGGFRVYVYALLTPISRVVAAALVLLLLLRKYPETGFFAWLKMPLEELLLMLALPAFAQGSGSPTLDAVRARGQLLCGTGGEIPGFSMVERRRLPGRSLPFFANGFRRSGSTSPACWFQPTLA